MTMTGSGTIFQRRTGHRASWSAWVLGAAVLLSCIMGDGFVRASNEGRGQDASPDASLPTSSSSSSKFLVMEKMRQRMFNPGAEGMRVSKKKATAFSNHFEPPADAKGAAADPAVQIAMYKHAARARLASKLTGIFEDTKQQVRARQAAKELVQARMVHAPEETL